MAFYQTLYNFPRGIMYFYLPWKLGKASIISIFSSVKTVARKRFSELLRVTELINDRVRIQFLLLTPCKCYSKTSLGHFDLSCPIKNLELGTIKDLVLM